MVGKRVHISSQQLATLGQLTGADLIAKAARIIDLFSVDVVTIVRRNSLDYIELQNGPDYDLQSNGPDKWWCKLIVWPFADVAMGGNDDGSTKRLSDRAQITFV